MKRVRRIRDTDQEGERGAWVLACWHCFYSVDLLFLCSWGGRPAADMHPTSARDQAYRWNGYHAAAKFKRSHRHLRGYVILNLAEIEEQARVQREVSEEWIAGRSEAGVEARGACAV